MKSSDVRKKFIEFFKTREHAEIPSAKLVPENDPTTLFTSCGMQPLIPYLLGQPHPSGKRLVNSQKSFRAEDIDEVGDNSHTTFFEMLGNWSLGDYFKKEQLPWIVSFLVNELNLNPTHLFTTIFIGTNTIPKDSESELILLDEYNNKMSKWFYDIGIKEVTVNSDPFKGIKETDRIFYYGTEKNWWSRSGEPDKMPPGEPGGPDCEIFYDFGKELHLHENSPFKAKQCHPNCDCGRFMEIANSVFMEFQKQPDGLVKPLQQINVDFGGGLERMTAASENESDVFKTDLFSSIIRTIELSTNSTYGKNEEETRAMRITADHLKAATFMICEGIVPGNKMQGYILRRLIRRAVVKMHTLNIHQSKTEIGRKIFQAVGKTYENIYFDINSSEFIQNETILGEEIDKFEEVLNKGMKLLEKQEKITGKFAFDLLQTYGFPWELTYELALERSQKINQQEFMEEFKKHQELSRTAAAGMFKGGLADSSVEVVKLHTATHLLHQALRTILGAHVSQKGSNITGKRLRFDYSHQTKLTDEQLKSVEISVNEQIEKDLPVTQTVSTYGEAVKNGALAFFGQRYPEKVKVYTIGDPKSSYFSREICGGPHVERTGGLGIFKILKEESAGAGIRRIYANLTPS